jgi:flavin-dependent thymidylate synthase
MTSSDIARYADVAMFRAEPDPMAEKGFAVRPSVTIISQTPKPLQVMAAAAELYRGKVVRSPDDVSMEQAIQWFEEMSRTKIQAALEFIDFHFLIEGVTRAFTHQLVRQRTAVFVQESMRFAVKENAGAEVAMPPSISALPPDSPMRKLWNDQVAHTSWVYNAMINGGIPAEDARGALPSNITTRVHYKTNLRNLADQAGMRLCSQAQYEWKYVWYQIIGAISAYGPREDRWQQEAIVSLFKPVCYQIGRCGFRGEHDRYCSIRERVEEHYAKGEGPDKWTNISPLEPLMAGAARMSTREAQENRQGSPAEGVAEDPGTP